MNDIYIYIYIYNCTPTQEITTVAVKKLTLRFRFYDCGSKNCETVAVRYGVKGDNVYGGSRVTDVPYK